MFTNNIRKLEIVCYLCGMNELERIKELIITCDIPRYSYDGEGEGYVYDKFIIETDLESNNLILKGYIKSTCIIGVEDETGEHYIINEDKDIDITSLKLGGESVKLPILEEKNLISWLKENIIIDIN